MARSNSHNKSSGIEDSPQVIIQDPNDIKIRFMRQLASNVPQRINKTGRGKEILFRNSTSLHSKQRVGEIEPKSIHRKTIINNTPQLKQNAIANFVSIDSDYEFRNSLNTMNQRNKVVLFKSSKKTILQPIKNMLDNDLKEDILQEMDSKNSLCSISVNSKVCEMNNPFDLNRVNFNSSKKHPYCISINGVSQKHSLNSLCSMTPHQPLIPSGFKQKTFVVSEEKDHFETSSESSSTESESDSDLNSELYRGLETYLKLRSLTKQDSLLGNKKLVPCESVSFYSNQSLKNSSSTNPNLLHSNTKSTKSAHDQKIRIDVTAEGREVINDRYELIKEIGSGAYSTVKKAKDLITQSYCVRFLVTQAIKIINVRRLKSRSFSGSPEAFDFEKEVSILKKLVNSMLNKNHPNIIKCKDVLVDNCSKYNYIVMDLVDGFHFGSAGFWKCVHRNSQALSEDIIRAMFTPLVEATRYRNLLAKSLVHKELNIAHRDIKLENIMVGKQGRNIKLIDFGVSEDFSNVMDRDDSTSTRVGSRLYHPPELYSEQHNNFKAMKVDIWALGCILHYLCYNSFPIAPCSDTQEFISNLRKW